jgi:hypothetical protein
MRPLGRRTAVQPRELRYRAVLSRDRCAPHPFSRGLRAQL